MYKKIPGSLEYAIDLKGTIVNHNGQEVTHCWNQKTDLVEIILFGKKRLISKKRLTLLAWYEVGSINNIECHLDNIKFYPNHKNLSSKTGFVMNFTEPIYYKDGFRYIPSFSRYAMNQTGDVLDTLTNSLITERTEYQGYVMIYLYSPDVSFNRTIRFHRLVALTWLPNTDYVIRPIINHKDGIRDNNNISNLEWCDYQHNNNHALEMGLITTAMRMKTRDVVTKEVVIYRSLSEMAEKLGMRTATWTNYSNKLPGFLYQRRYEIKLFDDNTPWYYEVNDRDPNGFAKSIYTITVVNKVTGENEKFLNVRTFYKTYKLWTKGGTIDEAVILFKEKYPDLDVSYKKNSVSGPYRVFDITANQITIFDSIWEAAENIDRSRTELQYDLSRDLKYVYSGKWIVATGLDPINRSDYQDKSKPFSKILIVKPDGTKIVAESIRHAAKISSLQARTITRYLNTGGTCTKGNIYRSLE
jgi:hypothetical protein